VCDLLNGRISNDPQGDKPHMRSMASFSMTRISRARHYSTFSISETAQDRDTVRPTMEDELELICDLSNCAIFSDLE